MSRWLPCALVCALLAACQPSAPAEPEAVEPAAADEASGDSASTGRIRVELREGPLSAEDSVGLALYSARYATAERIVAMLESGAATEDGAADVDSRRIRIWFGSNVHGELEDCGCHRNPLGGLGRRATMIADRDVEGDPIEAQFHLDAGNLLFKMAGVGENNGDLSGSQDAIHAHAIADGLVEMGIDGMALGEHDFLLGGDFLIALAAASHAPFVNTNVTSNGRTIGEPYRIVERDGYRIGVTAASSTAEPAPGYFERTGLTVAEPLAPTLAAIQALRAENVDLVILMSTAGIGGAETLVQQLAEAGGAPDLVLTSGTSRMLSDPSWVSGVPIYEAASRGKHLGQLDLYIRGGSRDFRPAGGDIVSSVREYMTTLRMANVAVENLDRVRDDQAREAQATIYTRNLAQYYDRINELMVDLGQRTDELVPQDAGPRSRIEAEIVPVAIELEQETNVRAIIDHAYDEVRDRFGIEPTIPQH